MKRILVCAALSIVSTAHAADLPSATPYQAPAAFDPGTNWSGLYIGAMGGYGSSKSLTSSVGAVSVTTSSDKLNGAFLGGTIGYNWQAWFAVFGVETDAAWSDVKYSETKFGITLADKVQAFGSVTGRVGFTTGAALFYGKGGYAWMENQFSELFLGITFADSHLHSGWTIGGGLEYMFLPNLSGKIEYMFTDYSNVAYLATAIGLGATFNTVKGGLNYHFGGR